MYTISEWQYLFFQIVSVQVQCYHREWGPIFRPFTPGPVGFANECTETETHACLRLPSPSLCRDRVSRPLKYIYPLPWWYFYCHWLASSRPQTRKTTSITVDPFISKTYKEFLSYRKNRAVNMI